ncbi:MAG: hydantoinase B/oxoprolinase family protein [Spirochaetota bacterium]|nr:MAG: hydantoinase B/oxoprolinase family protein [Spirochaetota bacterium]
MNEQIDSVRLAVIMSRFQGIVRNMANTLFRTGRSGVINIAHDFSCCILTKESELVMMADSLPIHVMRGPDIMAKTMKEFHPDLRRGDAFFHNSPYHGNSHAGDFAVIVPVVDEGGKHRFTALAKAHLADIGNALPTTYMASARDVYEEGALIFPAVKVQEDYRDIDDIIRMCKLRIRSPEVWWGDYLAILGAARIAERRLLELGTELGWNTLNECVHQWFDYSERMMESSIRKMPSGSITVTSKHDPFPGIPEGIQIKVTVKVQSDDGIIEVDLRDNPDCQPCGINQSEATARTHAQIGIFNSIPHTVPTNAGSFRRINILLRENCVVGIPRHPACCSVATTSLGNRIGNAVMRAIAELGEGLGMGEVGAIMPPSFAVISGYDPRIGGVPFINQLLLGAAGGSGSPAADGWLTIGDEGAMGMVHIDSIESDEFLYPICIKKRSIIPDSEGAGRFRGAHGTYVEYGPVHCSIEAMYASDGSVYPAAGARGGLSGSKAGQFKRTTSGELIQLGPMGPVTINPDETIISKGAGGGGYGPPWEREVWRVLKDVNEGWVTPERAEKVYGVYINESGQVDDEATKTLRIRMSKREV